MDLDKEKQLGYPGKVTVFSTPTKLTREELRRVIFIGSIVGVIVMTLFTTILFLGMLFFAKIVPYPEISIVGDAIGNVTADLSSLGLGNLELQPKFHMESKLHLS